MKKTVVMLSILVPTAAAVALFAFNYNKTVEVVEAAESAENQSSQVQIPEVVITAEMKQALVDAQYYIDNFAFSEESLFDQLASEMSDNYSREATNYAMENVKADYFAEALEMATNYDEIMDVNDEELFEQLTENPGTLFTEEQANQAIEKLNR